MTAIQLPRQCCGTCKWWERDAITEGAAIGGCGRSEHHRPIYGVGGVYGVERVAFTTDMQLCSKWEAAE